MNADVVGGKAWYSADSVVISNDVDAGGVAADDAIDVRSGDCVSGDGV